MLRQWNDSTVASQEWSDMRGLVPGVLFHSSSTMDISSQPLAKTNNGVWFQFLWDNLLAVIALLHKQ